MAQSQGGWRRLVLHQWAASRSGVIWDPSSIPRQHGGLRIPGQIKILFIPGHFQDSVYTRSLPRFCLYQVTSKILFIPGGVPLLTPASVWRRALGRPIHACRAIATAFA